jgi:hypothetical protein
MIGLCRVKCHSGSSIEEKSDRALRLQLHEMFIASDARPSIRGGK